MTTRRKPVKRWLVPVLDLYTTNDDQTNYIEMVKASDHEAANAAAVQAQREEALRQAENIVLAAATTWASKGSMRTAGKLRKVAEQIAAIRASGNDHEHT